MYIDRRFIFLIIALMLFSSFMSLFSNKGALLAFVISIPGILIAITFHEFAHAFAADKLGDDTPRRQGRLNLNPFKHLDLFGTIMLVFAGFGWGKPVEINPRNFNRNMSLSKAEAIVSAAGPLMNFILAILFGIVLCLIILFVPGISVINGIEGIEIITSSQTVRIAAEIVQSIIYINIGLGIFNLIPLPPLDGSKVLCGFLPYNAKNWIESHSQIFEMIFIALWIVGILTLIVRPIIKGVNEGLIYLFMQMFGII